MRQSSFISFLASALHFILAVKSKSYRQREKHFVKAAPEGKSIKSLE